MLNRYNPLHMFLASYGNELNRIDFRVLKESSGNNNLSSFSYNGLIYSFNPEINMFVNQFGHAMDYAQAAALAASLGYSEQEIEAMADTTDTDGGRDRRRGSASNLINKLVYNYSWTQAYGWPTYDQGGPSYLYPWPTEYNDQKGLSYTYPGIWYLSNLWGPTFAGVYQGNYSRNPGSFNFTGWTGIGNSLDDFYTYFWDRYPELLQPHVPADWSFGSRGHGNTYEIDATIATYSWIPPEHRMLFPGKMWGAWTNSGGITGFENAIRRNLILQSQTMHLSPWFTSNGATALSLGDTAPDGSLTATRIRYNNIAGTTSYNFAQNVTLSNPSATYSSSIWLRGLTAGLFVEFLPNQNISSSGGSWASISLGTAWTRYSAQFIVQPPATTMGQLVRVIGITNANIGFGNTYASEIMAWGGQIEENEISTDYIATTSSAVTSFVANGGNGQGWVSPYKARKAEYVEKEMRNVLQALKDRGFTLSGMINDDESFYSSAVYGLRRANTASPIEKNIFRTFSNPAGNTWWLGFTGASAAPRNLFLKTGVTNLRDLFILRGATTNPTQTFCVDLLNIDSSSNINSVNAGGSRDMWSASLWFHVIQEFIGYFVDDAMNDPFKEIMSGTNNQDAIINNYGYRQTYGGFVGNNPLPSTVNLVSPNVTTGIYPTNVLSEPKASYQVACIDSSAGSDLPEFSRCGNQGSINLYGPFSPNQLRLANSIGARYDTNGTFQFTAYDDLLDRQRVYYGNSYGYAGSDLGIKSNYAFVFASRIGSANTGPGRFHVPGNYRGISINSGSGFTFASNTLCTGSYARNYTGVSSGMGVTCNTCNSQVPTNLSWFFHDLFGITQATDGNGPINIIPTSIYSGLCGITQGMYTVAKLAQNSTLGDFNGTRGFWDVCGYPYPGITLLPGTIWRDYDTHWYPIGWASFVADLCQTRSMARTEMLNTFIARQSNPAAQQNPSHFWILEPEMAIGGPIGGVNSNAYQEINSQGINYYGYFKPLGITYDVGWNYESDGPLRLRGRWQFYGEVNAFWSEILRHAFLHKANSFTIWGGPQYSCVINPGRQYPAQQWNRPLKQLMYPLQNPNEVRAILGPSSVVATPAGNYGAEGNWPAGSCGFTLGGVCGALAYEAARKPDKILGECNTYCKGMVSETMYLAPIDVSEKEYHISGAQLVDGTYMWRITFLHPAKESINVRGSVTNNITTYNIAGITNFIDNANHQRGVWWSTQTYELPIVENPPQPTNSGLPAGTTTWNGISSFP